MAIQSFQLDPNAGGVSQAVFDAHVHNYRKLTQLGVDQSGTWANPTHVTVVDDTEVYAEDGTDLEGVGVTVATAPTSTPV